MGIARAGFHGTVGQPSAQVIDGSLLFDGSSTYLKRTPSSSGNRRTFTISLWAKYSKNQTSDQFWAGTGINDNWRVRGNSDGDVRLQVYNSGSNDANEKTAARFRDTGWYHFVYAVDTTQSTANDRQKIYVNGVLQDVDGGSNPSENLEVDVNHTNEHRIGAGDDGSGNSLNYYWAGRMSQVYLIDGQALEPGNFGFTDPLTNTWKPKKFDSFDNPNNGTTWSNLTTASSGAFEGSLPKTNLFDGIASNANRANLDTVGASIDIDFSSNPINVKNTISIWSGKASLSYSINGGAYVTYSDAQEAYKDIPFTGTLTSLSLKKSDEGAGASAIKIDGYVLLDGASDNSFYLPMDGNSPIGQDKSRKGNDYTPVNFGGSVALDSPAVSGARPILNTTQGSTQAGVGVFGSRENIVYTVTVSNPGSGNKYYLDGVEAPTLSNLVRGATYTFNQSDSSNGSHPLVFGSTAEGNNFARGANYGSISAGTAGAATTITIPYDAPETLYYHCSAHSGMGGSITGITTNEKLADQYASNCTLALPFIGTTPVDVSASIACTTSTKTLGTNGTPTTDVSNFYGSSPHLVGNASWYTLATTDDVEIGTGDYTLETYAYVHSFPVQYYYIFATAGSNTTGFAAWGLENNGQIRVTYYNGSSRPDVDSAAGTVTAGKWYHFAFSRTSGTQHIFVDGVCVARGTWSENVSTSPDIRWGTNPASPSTEYGNISLSDFRIYKGVGKYTASAVGEQAFVVPSAVPDILPDTPSGVVGGSKLTKITGGAVSFDGTGDYLRIASTSDFDQNPGTDFTAECFFYMTALSGPSHIFGFQIDANNRTSLYFTSGTNTLNWWTNLAGSNGNRVSTSNVSTNAWHHVAITRSGSTTTMWLDGISQGTSTTTDYPNGNQLLDIGTYNAGGSASDSFPGFISNVRYIKGTALYTSRFTPPTAPLTDVTNTKLLCCQSNTSATEGAVKPGTITANGNAIATNFNPFNTDINTVRGQETGYPTWNPLSVRSGVTFSDGNLTLTNSGSGASGWRNVACTQSVTSGKWYVEMHTIGSQNGGLMPGVCKLPEDQGTFNPGTFSNNFPGMTANSYSLNCFSGSKRTNGSDSSYGSAMAVGDMIMMCLDMDNGAIWWGKNGVWFASGDPAANSNAAFTGLTGEFVFACGISASEKIVTNFGQKPFKYAPPDGFQPLNTANTRPETVISRPDHYVGVTIGNFDTQKTHVTGFQPDLIWHKARSQAQSHFLTDSVRGKNSYLISNNTNAAGTFPQGGQYGITSFNYNGWTQGSYGPMSETSMVAWTWKAGGNKNTFNVDDEGFATAAAAGLDGGTATVTGASVGTKQGFSIIKFHTAGTNSGATIPHGLSKSPDFIVAKALNATLGWKIYHSSLGNDYFLEFDTGAKYNVSNYWGVTSSVFEADASGDLDLGSPGCISYCWHNVPGLQKFGSYEGNANANGPFIELGFRASVIIVKNADNADDWVIADTARSSFNVQDETLFPNSNNAEDTGSFYIDILSNGFKPRHSSGKWNSSGHTFIYAAFAEAPSVGLYGGGANAR